MFKILQPQINNKKMKPTELKAWLKKICSARRRAWQYSYSRNNEVSLLDVQKIENCCTFENPEKWCKENMDIISRVCTPSFYRQWNETVMPFLNEVLILNK